MIRQIQQTALTLLGRRAHRRGRLDLEAWSAVREAARRHGLTQPVWALIPDSPRSIRSMAEWYCARYLEQYGSERRG